MGQPSVDAGLVGGDEAVVPPTRCCRRRRCRHTGRRHHLPRAVFSPTSSPVAPESIRMPTIKLPLAFLISDDLHLIGLFGVQ